MSINAHVPTRKALMDKISTLGSTEHAEIFRILKKHGVPHTQNNNGVFVNITTVSDDIIKEVSDFVTFCFRNNKELEEYDKRLNQCKLYQNLDCMASSDSLDPESKGGGEEVPKDAAEQSVDLNGEQPTEEGGMNVVDKGSVIQQPNSSMQRFLESLENSMDTQGRRHQALGNTKFTAARKKYSKRIMADVTRTRGGADVIESSASELKVEPYII